MVVPLTNDLKPDTMNNTLDVSPRFPEGVCSIVAFKVNGLCPLFYKFADSLTLEVAIAFPAGKHIVLIIGLYFCQVMPQCLVHRLINYKDIVLAGLALFNS